ncbi:hypothetical protein TRVL_05064 [Trypanosoma vivax]|nr:hypothetical protein TRVL_05064 [Trypanosoma vivax]
MLVQQMLRVRRCGSPARHAISRVSEPQSEIGGLRVLPHTSTTRQSAERHNVKPKASTAACNTLPLAHRGCTYTFVGRAEREGSAVAKVPTHAPLLTRITHVHLLKSGNVYEARVVSLA